MKKLACVSILLLLMTISASAQQKIRYGFEAGFSVSFFDSPVAPHNDPALVQEFDKNARTSLELAVIADLSLSDAWVLSSGLEYVERGGSYRTKTPGVIYVNQFSGDKEDDAYNYLRYRLGYFEIPVRIKYDINKLINPDSEERWNIFAGPTAMFNVASKRRYNTFEGSGSDVEEKWDADKLSGANPFVFGWNAGIEWRAKALIMYVKYLQNITDLYDTSQAGYENFDTGMHSLSIGMGFEF